MARQYGNLAFVDVGQRFQQGREAGQRNRMAEMGIAQQEAAMDRESQVDSMLGQMGSVEPEQRQQFLGNMASQGREGLATSMQVHEMWGRMDDRQKQSMQSKLQENARMLAGVKDQDSYNQVRDYALKVNPQIADEMPEEYDPNVVGAFVNRFRDLEKIMGGESGPSIGTYNPRDYTVDSFAEFTRSRDPSVLERYESQRNVDIGGVPHRFDPARGGYFPAEVGGGMGSAQQPREERPTPITAESVGQSEATIKQIVAERTPETGMRFDESGGMIPIPGGKVARELESIAKRQQTRTEQTQRAGETVVQDLGRALELLDKFPTLAAGSATLLQPKTGFTPAGQMQQFVESALSNVGIDQLQQMRESSPTGGALGNVAMQQQARLEQLLGSLRIDQPRDVLEDNIKRIQNIYLDVIHGTGNGPSRQRLSFDNMGRKIEGGYSWGGDPAIMEAEQQSAATPWPIQRGHVEDGHRFVGDDPANPNDWEQI